MTVERSSARPAGLDVVSTNGRRGPRPWSGVNWLVWLRDFAILIGGLFLFSLAVSLTLLSDLGANSWTVLHDGIARQTPLTIGQAAQIVGLLMLAVSWLSGIRPGIGTVMNMFLVGLFMDLILAAGVIPTPGTLPLQVAMLVVAVLGMGIATGLYIKAGMGAGPRDSFMLVMTRVTGWRVGVIRWAMEVVVVVIGLALGGSFGVGTIIFALLVGPSVDLGFRIFKLAPRRAGR